MAPSYASAPVLPPLHKVIPEFHSAMPSHRSSGEHSSALDPRLADRYSPPNSTSRHYPGPSHAFDNGVRMTPSPTRRMEAQFNNGPVDPRRLSVMSTDSQYLPPVSSIASSRGSSFDLETSDGSSPYRNGNLPPLAHSTRSPSMSYPEVQPNSWDDNGRYQMYQQDYRQYGTESPMGAGPYRGGSPGRSMMPGQYRQPYLQGHMDGMEPVDARSGKRKRGNLPKHVTDILRQWFDEHENHPYPTEEEKQMLLIKTGLAMSQISNWFINARRRRAPNPSCRRD